MKLRRTIQCAKCPWKKSTNPLEIPNEYSLEKHKALIQTIALQDPIGQLSNVDEPLNVMACHEGHEDYCIGYLYNQLGVGNNIRLRLQMLSCENANQIEVVGEQHQHFEQTLPLKTG